MGGFAAVNGTRLYYEIAGSGPPLVLIHGHGLDSRMWDDQFAPFAAHYRVVRYDMRGFGQSAVVGEIPYTHEEDLAALLDLDYLAIARAAILGLSSGGAIAIDFALAYPAKTRALIVVDAALGGHAWSEEWSARWKGLRQTARTADAFAANEQWLAHPLVAPAQEQPAVAARLRQMVTGYSGWHWGNRDPQRGSEPPATERLRDITAPTLVILGERDLSDFHVIADTIIEQVSGARKLVLPGVGHMANMEAPEQFNAGVLGFLAAI